VLKEVAKEIMKYIKKDVIQENDKEILLNLISEKISGSISKLMDS
jgi:hypothetical protein